jgi:hypothetical protein
MLYRNLPIALLQRVDPVAAQHYVLATGWHCVGDARGLLGIYAHPRSDTAQVLVPLHDRYSGYERSVGELVCWLAEWEHRPAAHILTELLLFAADWLRFKVAGQGTEKGFLPLNQALALFRGARRLLLAAAHDALEPAEAEPFVQSCFLGPTEHDGFTAVLACPLGASLPGNSRPPEEPAARRVTQLLMGALQQLAGAAGPAEQPNGHVAVSADLCEALLELRPHGDQALTVSVAWAPTVPLPPGTDRSSAVRLGPEHFPVLERLAARLRTEPEARPLRELAEKTA